MKKDMNAVISIKKSTIILLFLRFHET